MENPDQKNSTLAVDVAPNRPALNDLHTELESCEACFEDGCIKFVMSASGNTAKRSDKRANAFLTVADAVSLHRLITDATRKDSEGSDYEVSSVAFLTLEDAEDLHHQLGIAIDEYRSSLTLAKLAEAT